MEKKHHLAEYQAKVKAEGILAVKTFFELHPYKNMKACAEKTGLSYQTVFRHVRHLKKEREADKSTT